MSEPKMYGWYSSPDQAVPDYDPPLDAPCPHCGLPMSLIDVRTHSFVSAEGDPERSYFYRVHATCDERASDRGRQNIFAAVVEQIAKVEGFGP